MTAIVSFVTAPLSMFVAATILAIMLILWALLMGAEYLSRFVKG